MKTVLISQDFVPQVGGIARYLTDLSHSYFGNVSTVTDAAHPYGGSIPGISQGISVPFYPFKNFDNPARRETNDIILDYITKVNPDLVVFGYVRSHVELSRELRSQSIKTGFVGHAKELFFHARPSQDQTSSHKGYLPNQEEEYISAINDLNFGITVSNYTKGLLLEQGINIPLFVAPPVMGHIQRRSKMPSEKLHMLSVGRLIPRKGQRKLVSLLNSDFMSDNSLHYDIVGNGPDEAEIRDLILQRDLSGYVSLHTNKTDSDLEGFYAQSDFFVLPTTHLPPNDVEGLGIVFIEAQQRGLPVIGGPEGGVPETISVGSSGFLYKSDADLLQRLSQLAKDNSLRKKMGEQGKEFVKSNFSKINMDLYNFIRQ